MSADPPLFSICIPSRNRLEAVKLTVLSVLNQPFESWEIIIADNSTCDHGEIAAWVTSLGLPESKIRVVETGGNLEMDQNWVAATRPATGRYVLVVADRWRLRNGALKVFADVVDKIEPDLFFWPGTKYGQLEAFLTGHNPLPPIQVSKLSASDVLAEFLEFRGFETNSVYGQAIPRALNTGYRREIGERACEIWGELFRPISPDYTSAMAFLLLSESCAKIHEMMYVPIQNVGSNFSDSSVLGLGHYLTKFPGCHIWHSLREDIVFSTVLNDVENTLNATSDGRAWISRINVENALKSMMCELNFKEFYGSLLPIDRMRDEIIRLARREGLTEIQIKSIEDYVNKSRHRMVALRRILRRIGIYKTVLAVNNRLRYARRKIDSSSLFAAEDTASRALKINSGEL